MTNATERLSIVRLSDEEEKNTRDVIVRELHLSITLNDQEVVTLHCSPTDLKNLALGFLVSTGLLKSKDEIKDIAANIEAGMVRVTTKAVRKLAQYKGFITSGGGRMLHSYQADTTIKKVMSPMEISANEVFALISEFVQHSRVFKATGGTHSAAMCDTKNILVFGEDIGRHNAIDKIFVQCLLDGISTDELVIATSGRISSEIVLKIAQRNIPILISKSGPHQPRGEFS